MATTRQAPTTIDVDDATVDAMIELDPREPGRHNARFVEYGYSWVAVGSDMAMLLTLARDYLAQLRTVAPARSAPAPDRAS